MISDPGKNGTEEQLERELEEIRRTLDGRNPPEPPQLLDQAVLNAARRELEGRQKPRLLSLRWMGAFATASVVLLALGIVVQQEQESATLTNGEGDRARLQSEPEAVEKADRAASPALMKQADRHDSAMKRAAPAAAAELRSADFAAEEMADAPTALKEEADRAVHSPGEWIELMLELKASGQEESLARELAAFRSAYPDHPLPPELTR